jgi:hypothetical protein
VYHYNNTYFSIKYNNSKPERVLEQELIDQFPNFGELHLIQELMHEIRNFKPGFSLNKVKQTLILSNYTSRSIGYDIIDDQPYIGVPDKIFNAFIKVRWYLVCGIPGKSGIYMIMDFGRKPNNKAVALRINTRPRLVDGFLKFKTVKFIAIDEDGSFNKPTNNNSFDLPIECIEDLFWEKNN